MESSKLSKLFNNHPYTAFLTVRLPRDLNTAQAKDWIRKRVVMPLQRRLKTQIAFIGVVVKHQPAVDVYAHAHVSLFTKDGHTAEQMRAVLDLSQTTPSKPPSSSHREEINLIQQTPAHAGYYDKPTNYGDLIAYGTSLLKGWPSIDLSCPPLAPQNQSLEHR